MMARGGRVAVVGAGPSGLVAAKYAIEAGFDVVVFEAADDLGGQWHTAADHSGVWPGMHTNTSRAMTAFSDFPAPADYPLHPVAEQVRAYLVAYARTFGVVDRIRFRSPVESVRPGWEVNGEPFDYVVLASGRFRNPSMPGAVQPFKGELLHAFDYPGAEPFRDRRTLVYGNGISGVEIASDLAGTAPVVSAFRKPRYVIQKVVDGVSSDWQWYTLYGALERRFLSSDEWSDVNGNESCASPAIRLISAPRSPIPTFALPVCRSVRITSRRSARARSRRARRSPRRRVGR